MSDSEKIYPDTQDEQEEVRDAENACLPVVPLPDVVIFPDSISPLFVVRPQSIAAVDEAALHENQIFLVTQKSANNENPKTEDLHMVGTVSQILQVQRMPDNSVRIFVEGMTVMDVDEYFVEKNCVMADLSKHYYNWDVDGRRLTALKRALLKQFETYARLSERIPEDLFLNIKNIDEALTLTHAITNYSSLKTEDKQAILEMNDISAKFMHLSKVFSVENELLSMEGKILNQVKSQIGKNQKEYFLSEQLKIIEKELGIGGDEDVELEEIQKDINESKMSEEARNKAQKELNRLSRMAPMSPEYSVSRSYVEWLVEYPWQVRTKDKLSLKRASDILNEDHFGLEKVKERILEYLAVLKLVKDSMRGPILCLVGPPGVGKTSLARSVARALGRQFVRFSLGGVRDEAEIRGHRRTYVGALPGKIVQMMKKAESENPVLLLDEIDKMSADFRGDPASALLEVLDPEQNKNFNDHYMEVDLDLSNVLFLTTANTTDGIPWALQDRMEIIRLPGYTRDEKLEIAKRFLVPRQIEAHGLSDELVEFPKDGLEFIIDHYTREAGVRNLEREIAALARKTARKIGGKRKKTKVELSPEEIRSLLGPVRFKDLARWHDPEVGVATGLAWTEVGGEILDVEVSTMPGSGKLTLTGKLGDVMQESAKAAVTYIRAHSEELGVDPDFHKNLDIHIHLPEGAIPKDGPSAGITMTTALVSALSGRFVRRDFAMTGEITLRGKVLKIGGLKEKVVAAHRQKIETVIIPEDNEDDLEDIARHIRKDLKFVPVGTIGEVLDKALLPKGQTQVEKKKTGGSKKKARKKTKRASRTSQRA
ncbi:MAG: endopeptidase La [Candidatus Sumerlaeia bacterium]